MNIKPCPFCGGHARRFFKEVPGGHVPLPLYWIVCDTQGCRAGVARGETTCQAAEEKWNNRAGEKQAAIRIIRALANEAADWMKRRNADKHVFDRLSNCRTTEFLIKLTKILASIGGLRK